MTIGERLEPADLKIGLKRHLAPVWTSDGQAYLLGERTATAVLGDDAARLLPLLDGTRSTDALVRHADGSSDRVAGVLHELARRNLLTCHDNAEDDSLAWWDAAGHHGLEATDRLATATVAVLATDHTLDTATLRHGLREAGVGAVVDSALGSPTLTVVLCQDYLDDELPRIARELHDRGLPWVLCKPTGVAHWVGPYFTTGEACWFCLENRLRPNLRPYGHLVDRAPALPSSRFGVATRATLNGLAVDVAMWLVTESSDRHRRITVQDFATGDIDHHRVHRRPQCPVCGDPDLVRRRVTAPLALSAAPRADAADENGYRTAGSRETFERYRHLVDPLTGVVTEVVKDDRAPHGLVSYRSGPNLGLGPRTLTGLRTALRAHSGGKGPEDQARTGALCEAVERFSGTFQGDEPVVHGTLAELAPRAVDPRTCQLYDPRQFPDRARWNEQHGTMVAVPEEFDPSAYLGWTPVWSLTEGRSRLLPTSMLYFDAPGPLCADSNGCAAGSSLPDAVLQGLLELIERDAVAIWWYNRSRLPGVDLSSAADPWIDGVVTAYDRLGRDVWVLDVSADLGVPVMAAVSARRGTGDRIMVGFGAHLDARLAARRAVAELNQTLPWALDPLPASSGDPDLDRWLADARLADLPYLLPAPGGLRRLEETNDRLVDVATIDEAVISLVDRLRQADIDVLVLDQTRPDLELPVVRVLAPGLRSFWPRLAPGRLFDVPVALGRQESPTPYGDLNPIPLFV